MLETIILILIFIGAGVFAYRALRNDIKNPSCGGCKKNKRNKL